LVTRVIYLLFALGGLSSLIYEVMWMRSFRLVFGSSTRSAAAVLAAYFGGLALGSLIGAALAQRGRLVRRYGMAEIAVGFSALLVGPWLAVYQAFYPQLYAWSGGQSATLLAGKLLLALVALGPPAIAMGITLPLVVSAVVTRADHVARRTGLVYALNIGGATAGALLAGFYLPLAVGVRASVYLAAGINLAVGTVALLLGEQPQDRPAEKPDADASQRALARRPGPALLLLAAAAISGFGTLALEVFYLRLLSQGTENSVYSFGTMLVLFLLFLAAGSAVVARWLDRVDPWRFLAWTQLAAVAAIGISVPLFSWVAEQGLFAGRDPLSTRLLRLALASGAILGLPILLTGVVLPTTWKMASRGTAEVGRGVGQLAAVNTLAAVCGSLVAGFLLLPRLGLRSSVLVVVSLYALLAMIAFVRGYRGGRRRWLAGAGCALAVACCFLPGVGGQPLQSGERLLSYHDGESATVAVVERPGGHRLLKMNHEYVLGSTAAAVREVRQGRLPLLLHARPERVALIGVATGITASAVLDFPVKRVVALELVPGVVDALPLFADWNRSFYKDPRVELVVADGRNYLLGTRAEFDVIISDLFVPWRAGTGDLYTVEHFEVVRRRLAPGGIFAQWLPGYQLSVGQLRTICHSLAEVFPAVTLWRNDFHPDQPPLAVVAYRDGPVLDAASVRAGCRRLAKVARPPAPLLSDPVGVELLYVCGDAALRNWASGAALNTDDFPIIEYTTPASSFRRARELLPPLRELLAGFRPRSWCYPQLPAPDRPIDEVLHAADLMLDANAARGEQNFEVEFRLVKQLAELLGDVRGSADFVTNVASRYRERQMTARSDELLDALVGYPAPPVAALVALAKSKRLDGRDAEATALLERAVDQAPDHRPLRRRLVDLLIDQHQYARAEPHLRHLVKDHPDDPRQRLLLAHVLDQQRKTSAAANQIKQFQQRWDGTDREAIWNYLRSLKLGLYVD